MGTSAPNRVLKPPARPAVARGTDEAMTAPGSLAGCTATSPLERRRSAAVAAAAAMVALPTHRPHRSPAVSAEPRPAGVALLPVAPALWPEKETRHRAPGTAEVGEGALYNQDSVPPVLSTSARRRTAAVARGRQRAG